MSVTGAELRSAAAKKAWRTRRRRLAGQKAAATRKKRVREAAILREVRRRARAAIVRARKSGIEFDEDLVESAVDAVRGQNLRCAVTGIEFDVAYRTSGAGGAHLSPSPDRIDPTRGYVTDNVRWVIWAVNRFKGRMPDELFHQISAALAKGIG